MSKKDWYEPFRSQLPLAEEGMWRIVEGYIESAEGNRGWQWEKEVPGQGYRVLQQYEEYDWKTYMADSVNEVADALPFVSRAYGHVLITGLGLSILPRMLATKPNVESITILEIAPEVVELVKSDIPDSPSTQVIIADAFRWHPWRKFDCAFHDIWPSYGSSIVEEIDTLMERYDPFVLDFQMGWLYELSTIIKIYNNSDPAVRDDKVFAEECIVESAEGGMLRDYLKERDRAKKLKNWDYETTTKVGEIHAGIRT